jgi:type I restriction enzyme R subunit
MIHSNDHKSTPALRLDERTAVENPLLDQLEGLGWTVQRLEMSAPADATGRASFREVVLAGELTAALRDLNPFLEADQVDELAGRLIHLTPTGLLENNRAVHDLLTGFPSVGENRQTGEVSPTVRYIDFESPQNNRLRAVSQFKVAVPGTDHHIIPDVVLFVNGLPLVVIECKSPLVSEPLASAIDQLQRYSRQRGEAAEGNPALFWYNQFLIVTCRNQAKFGTLTTPIEKLWYSWRDPYPLKLSDLPTAGGTGANDQQRLVAGMCRPENLLSLLQSFTLFSTDEKGRTLKIVGRYQQFRAVRKAVQRLHDGRNARERSGIIWHTQGSGKSLTMMFLVREMRRLREFADWKIVFITDRTQLEDQLTETAAGLGRTVKTAGSIAQLRALLSSPASDLVMAMVHKFQEPNADQTFPLLNDSPRILTLTDEAHRSQYGLLGANLDRAIPNAARVAYTGTPIEKTESTFGDYIDKYTMRESIEDGTTLAIVYEGRTHRASVPDRAGADQKFEDVFSENSLTERLQILGYGSRGAYMEADSTIEAKARDMVDHYVAQVFPNGFKGQVVACSREAAAKYQGALDRAIAAKIAELEAADGRLALGDGVVLQIPLDRLRALETAVVISGGSHNDKPALKALSDARDHARSIRRFKMPFGTEAEDEDGAPLAGTVGLIIVNKMLLTGFDAPLEQVLYLDDVVRDHTLLQTIARVNRVADDTKEVGYIVDYVGIGNDLKSALGAYAEKEQGEILAEIVSPDEELGKLKEAHRALWGLLHAHGLHDFSDPDAFFDLFYDEDVRFAYILAFQALTKAFNVVLQGGPGISGRLPGLRQDQRAGGAAPPRPPPVHARHPRQAARHHRRLPRVRRHWCARGPHLDFGRRLPERRRGPRPDPHQGGGSGTRHPQPPGRGRAGRPGARRLLRRRAVGAPAALRGQLGRRVRGPGRAAPPDRRQRTGANLRPGPAPPDAALPHLPSRDIRGHPSRRRTAFRAGQPDPAGKRSSGAGASDRRLLALRPRPGAPETRTPGPVSGGARRPALPVSQSPQSDLADAGVGAGKQRPACR